MRTALDTNLPSALWSRESTARNVAASLLRAQAAGELVVCATVDAELLAHPHATEEFVDGFLARTGIAVDWRMDEPVWREAARRFARYAVRRRQSGGGSAKRLLADFLVGAHALLRADRLLTLDAGRYGEDFPELVLVGVE